MTLTLGRSSKLQRRTARLHAGCDSARDCDHPAPRQGSLSDVRLREFGNLENRQRKIPGIEASQHDAKIQRLHLGLEPHIVQHLGDGARNHDARPIRARQKRDGRSVLEGSPGCAGIEHQCRKICLPTVPRIVLPLRRAEVSVRFLDPICLGLASLLLLLVITLGADGS